MHMHMHMKTYSRVVYAQMSRQSRTATLQAKMKETSVRKMHSVTVRSWVSSDIRTTKREKKREKKYALSQVRSRVSSDIRTREHLFH